MTIINPEFKYLYSYSNSSLALFEIKRLDKASGAPPSEVYAWLVIQNNEVTKLTFQAMKKDEVEYRKFSEAELNFDSTKATLVFRGKKFELIQEKNPETFRTLISQHLK